MCGVVGLIGTPNAAHEAFLALTTLQHRGQDAAGILTDDSDGFHTVKNLGLVESIFTRQSLEPLTGTTALAHARYSTVGRGDLGDVQPLVVNYPFGIAMVHNGNIVNTRELSADLKKRSRRHLLTHSDTELVLNLFAETLAAESGEALSFESILAASQTLFTRVNGSFSLVALVAGQGLLAFRDPHGIRPLVMGSRPEPAAPGGKAYMVASESNALSFLGFESFEDVKPGEVIWIDSQGGVHRKTLAQKPLRTCMFEWVYFASPESIVDSAPVYGTRIELGHALARTVKDELSKRGLKPDVIVPVPETSRIAAIALSDMLQIPYRELLIKNRYIKRTFILDSTEKRQRAVHLKLSPVRSEIKGKHVLLVDDSIVRGTTSRKLIELVRSAGAASVYFVSTCPPIEHPCYYGIDFPDENELIAHGRTEKQIEAELGADAVIYQTLEGLKQSIARVGGPKNPCDACLTGAYPTDVSAATGLGSERRKDRLANAGGKP